MTPFVIDNQVRRRYISVFVLLLIISFMLGYASGFYMGTQDNGLMPAVSDTDVVVPALPAQEEPSPGADEKKDASPQPEVKSEVSPPAKADKPTASATPPKTAKTPPVAPPAVIPDRQVKQTPAPPETMAEKKPSPVKTLSQKPEPDKPVHAVAANLSPEIKTPDIRQEQTNAQPVQPALMGEALPAADGITEAYQSDQRIFSVQVGMFANRENAMNLVEELKNGGFDAYLDDYIASGGEVKYNVRFGRESDRNLIQQQLNKYKQQFSTSAYIIISK